MDLALLRTFVTVHRAGSFTRAAALLGLSQPAVTSQIRTLERQLGRPLFLRQARGVTPTTIGDELAHRAAPHLDALVEIAETGLDEESAVRTLHLAGPPEFTSLRALPALTPLIAPGARAAGLLRQRRGDAGGAGRRAPRSGHHHRPSARRPAHRDSALRRGARPGRRPALGGPARARTLLRKGPCGAGAAARGGGARVPAPRLPLLGRRLRLPAGRRGHRHRPRPAGGPGDCAASGAGLAVLPRYLCEDALERGRGRGAARSCRCPRCARTSWSYAPARSPCRTSRGRTSGCCAPPPTGER